MCCNNLKKKLGEGDCYKTDSTVVKDSVGNRRFEVERTKPHKGCCAISIDCLKIEGDDKRCDHVISICHPEKGKPDFMSHYFVEFKDSRSSKQPLEQIKATIKHFEAKKVPMHHGHVYGAIITTKGINSSLTARKEIWVKEFRKAYGTKLMVSNGQHTTKF